MASTSEDGFVTSHDGVRVAYRDHGGTGRGLVPLHGGGANLVSMDQYANRLGAGRRSVTHLAPAWDVLDDIVPIVVEAFLSRPLP